MRDLRDLHELHILDAHDSLDATIAALRERLQALSPVSAGFHPPDEGAAYTPYACSYHWFRAPNGRAISLDLIRSDDSGNLGLRVMRETEGGELQALVHIAPKAQWLPFACDGSLPARDVDPTRPYLSRSSVQIAGTCRTERHDRKSELHSVRFQLSLSIVEPGQGTGQLGLGLAHLVATDFLRVAYRGFVELDDERIDIDSLGTLSLHAGDALPQYAYLLSLPGTHESEKAQAPQILLGAVRHDALRVFGKLLGSRSLIYAHARSGMPPFSLHIGELDRGLSLGISGRIEIQALRACVHDFLGQPTCTGIVQARFQPAVGEAVDLGTAYIDFRGRHYLRSLDRLLPGSLPGALLEPEEGT